MSDQYLHEIEARIKQHRDAGSVRFDVRQHSAQSGHCNSETIDHYIESFGYSQLGSLWTELTRTDAEMILVSILHKDMAYNLQAMELDLAQETAKLFIDIFAEPAKFYSNSKWQPDISGKRRISSWQPITQATFDSGIVACDSTRIGLIWVEDED